MSERMELHDDDLKKVSGGTGTFNPEDDICSICNFCVFVCPCSAIAIVDSKPKIDREKCVGCGACVSNCASGRITDHDIAQSNG